VNSRQKRGSLRRRIRRATATAALTCIAALITACGSSPSPSAAPTKTVTSAAPATTGAATPAAASSSRSPSDTVQPAGADTFIAQGSDISGTPLHKPACPSGCSLSGDSTVSLNNMSWSTWTGTEAVGSGTEGLNDCIPNCATGSQHPVPVVVTLSRPVRDCSAPSGTTRWFWSRASFSYPQGLPIIFQGNNAVSKLLVFTLLVDEAKQSCPEPVGTVYKVYDSHGNVMTVKLTNVIDPAQGVDQSSTPNNGFRLVGAVFTLSGVSGTFSDDANSNATIVGSNGLSYTASANSIAGVTNFNNYILTPGVHSVGAVTFQIPTGIKVSAIQWSADGGFGGAPVTWTLP
jgi:hypothetical protein